MKYILASRSPRRRELFSLFDLPYHIVSPDIEERQNQGETPLTYVNRLSHQKALAAGTQTDGNANVIAADTIVVLDGGVLEKPRDNAEAYTMLDRLRGRSHMVLTAVSFLDQVDDRFYEVTAESAVPMRAYSDDEVGRYIDSGDPFDKAGAYAIQHKGFHPVENFTGCFANVMGLPLCHLFSLLDASGIRPEIKIQVRCQSHLAYSCPAYPLYLPPDAL